MVEDTAPDYGTTRARGVSYAQVEAAAIGILKGGGRPTVEAVRAALGTGSPATLADALKRFWRDLGARAEGDPAALTRMPSDIAEIADGMWQRALALASQAAKTDNNAAKERLDQVRRENNLRAQSFALREKELEAAARAREAALSDAREHVRTLMGLLSSDRALLQARDARVADLERQVEEYRRQLAALITRAVTKHRALVTGKPTRVVKAKPRPKAKRKTVLKHRTRPKRTKRRAKR